VVAWQAALILALAVYALLVGRSHPRDLSWIAPPIAALIGTALPLQLAVGRIVRAAIH
jgi:hypothetical protein